MTIGGALTHVSVGQNATIRQAMEAIDRGASAVALITDELGKLRGVLTDGDLRRGLLNGAELDGPADIYASTAPHVVGPDATRASVLDLMRSLRISEVPVVDNSGMLVGLHTLNDMLGRKSLSNIAVIMAGGKGTRLGALTRDTPKPLMTVADRTIIEWIILGLVESGVTNIYVSVAYLAEKIMVHLGDGSRLGCTIKYLHEDPAKPLNTAGALGILHHEVPNIYEPVLVTNADLMVRYSAADLLAFHDSKKASVTVAARPYTHQVPFGVLDVGEGRSISAVVEKPSIEFEISTGIYAVSPDALALVPYLEPFSMPELVQACISQSKTVAAWPIESDWIDVGTPKDLATAKGH